MLSRRDFLLLGLAATTKTCHGHPGHEWLGLPAQDSQSEGAFIGQEVFDRLIRTAWKSQKVGELTGEVAMSLIGTPYLGGTLELYDDKEVSCVNLRSLDCVTLYETALCFARMYLRGGRKPSDLLEEITLTRYRGGKLDGYLSRLHYTSDWIYDNDRKRVVSDITSTLPGAVRMIKRFDFMNTHPASYRQLKASLDLTKRMAAIEDQISKRNPWYVPNDRVAAIEPLLQTGDIVGIATSTEGLDCSHTGLIQVDNAGARRFLNASSVKKEVVLGERLSEYANKYKKNLGVMIARPLPLRS
jgi:hypothetical protein